MKLILASSSVHRKALLDRLGVRYSIVAPDLVEEVQPGEGPVELVERLAIAKARSVAKTLAAPGLVIGADQSAVSGGHQLTKPGTRERAVDQLRRQSGRSITFYTGVCLLNSASGLCQSAVESCVVKVRSLSEAQIHAYVDAESPLDAAGAFKVEGLGIALFESVESRDPTTLVGLPLIRLVAFLAREGIDVLVPS